MKAFMKSKEEVLTFFDVKEENGLSKQQILKNREEYGENSLSKAKPESILRRFIHSASEPMILMLIAAGLITLIVNLLRFVRGTETDFLECVGIFGAISLSVIITVIMEGKSAKAFEVLSKMNEDTLIKVLRGSEIMLISQGEVVAGDIVYIETGDKIPADGRLLEASCLKVDESSLTGESLPVGKDEFVVYTKESIPVAERINMLYSGSFVTGGSGKMIVTTVGDGTEFGKIATELSKTDKGTTPLQEKLARLGKTITIMGVTMAAIVFAIQVILFVMNGTANLDTISEAFITSIVLIVAAVPEGLPTIVAVSLAVNIIKMSKQNALVKKMIACETIGCINVVCSDKTGTLTENRMTVVKVCSKGKMIEPSTINDRHLMNNFALNSTADVNFQSNIPKFIGNPTESALLVALHKSDINYLALRNDCIIHTSFPFCSENKNMTTVINADGSYVAYTKGSPEKILGMCTMNESVKKEIESQIANYQSQAMRIIAFAHKETTTAFYEQTAWEEQMEFDGYVVIKDPLRQDVYDAVKKCRSAGIDMKILTGDNLITARAIANELELLEDGYLAMEAREIEEMDDVALLKLLPKIRVIARSTPTVKMRIVKTLKDASYVVAVTGDGINDAPAIKNADVGIAMGISGTEVSKEASDIVLLNDSFSTIIKAVQWGRGIYENFQRFIQFQLTVNLSSVIVVLFSILAGFKSPFTALELLWINIIMDGPPALTLGLEPIRDDLMKNRPISRTANIVSKGMLSRITFNGIYISVIFMLQTIFNFLDGTREQESTILFTLFVIFQLFNAFNSRELSNKSIFNNLMSNKLMLIVISITFSLQVIITQWGGAFFGTVPLPLTIWLKIIGVGFTVIILSEIVKFVKRSVTYSRK